MKILIDNIPDLASAEPGATLGVVLAELEAWLRREGRAVREFRLDGAPLTPARRRDLASSAADAYGELAAATVDRFVHPLEVLAGLRESLGALEALHVRAAERLQAGEGRGGLTELQRCLADWILMIEGVVGASTISGVPLPAGSEEDLRGTSDRLRDLARALGAGDAVRLADLVEHELRPRVGILGEVIDGLIAAVRTAAEAPPPG